MNDWVTWVLLVSAVVQFGLLINTRARLKRRTKDLLTINAATLKAMTSIIDTSAEQSKINTAQHELNQLIGHNLEVLGVHTRLIKPSVGFEAEQFLSWYNNKKGKDNGEV